MLDRTRTQQRKFKRLTADQLGGSSATAAPRHAGEDPGAGPGPSTDPSGPDDPADPTDTVSDVPPLEDPVSGEPPVAP